MAPSRASITRRISSDSSMGSNIEVRGTAEDSGSEQPSASTPPTSVSDNRSMQSSKATDDATQSPPGSASKRPRRARASVGSYNLKELSERTIPAVLAGSRKASGLSGRTLVDDIDEKETANATLGDTLENALNPDWEIPAKLPKGKQTSRIQRKPSMRDRVKNAAGNVRSVLGKRTRDMVETGKRKLGMQTESKSPQPNKLLKELDMGKKGVLDELDLDEDYNVPLPPRPTKRAKKDAKTILQEIAQPILSGPLQKTSNGKKVKKWQTHGLYVGQEADYDPENPKSKKLLKKRPMSAVSDESSGDPVKKRKLENSIHFTLPLFSYLEKERSFAIPYDVFAPSLRKGDERPKDWKQLNRNRLIGGAKDDWKNREHLESSNCVCWKQQPAEGGLGCGEHCLNRIMQYECNEDNCKLPADMCGNRQFAELGERIKKGGKYDVGVEVVKTENRGFGIRASRSFLPGQIIMEYTGEIIDEEECQRRMREDYKDKKCYYLMEMERNFIIDGTRGSMARFINHSCEPNCEVHMIKVNNTPRMAVFAGNDGIMTGEELTYDYNFDNFGDAQQQCFCGASTCRGFLSKRRNANEMRKLVKEEAERKRKEYEIAQKQAAADARKKQNKNDPSNIPGWRGWVPVDDPAVKAKLKEEKRIAEEKAKNSSRAQRLAKRQAEESAAPKSESKAKRSPPKKKASPRRKTTVATTEEVKKLISSADDEEEEGDLAEAALQKTRLRRTSTGSRFTEGLDPDQRPASCQSARSSIFRKKTTVSMTTSGEVQSSTITEDEVTIASVAQTSLSRSSSKKSKKGDEDEVLTKPKRNSLIGSMSAKVGEKMFGSTSGKLRQSTLSFARKG